MAARRLVILMVVLLAVSTLAAALIPVPDDSDDSDGERTGTLRGAPPAARPGPAPAPSTREVRARIDTAASPPQRVEVRVGDRLSLLVTSTFSDSVEIPALGLLRAVDPDAPAMFDLLIGRAGGFDVRTLEAGLVAGCVVATAPSELSPRARPGRSPAPASGRHGEREQAAGDRSDRPPSVAGDRRRRQGACRLRR